MKKRLLSAAAALCLALSLFAGLSPAVQAADDTIKGYLVPYTVKAGDTIYGICQANNIDFSDTLALYRLREIIKETHVDASLRFYFGEEFMTLGELVHWLYNFHKPGDKFYIGGILDYHF